MPEINNEETCETENRVFNGDRKTGYQLAEE